MLDSPHYCAVWLCACPSRDNHRYTSTNELHISIVTIITTIIITERSITAKVIQQK